DPHGLAGKTIGITRLGLGGFTNVTTPQPVTDAVEAAFASISSAGATVVDLDKIVDSSGNPVYNFSGGPGEFLGLCFDFVNDVAAYFQTRVGVPVAGGTLDTAIAFNSAHADVEMPFFNQDLFEFCNSLPTGPDDPQPIFGMTYNQALAADAAYTQQT